jgi:hypothetical protein
LVLPMFGVPVAMADLGVTVGMTPTPVTTVPVRTDGSQGQQASNNNEKRLCEGLEFDADKKLKTSQPKFDRWVQNLNGSNQEHRSGPGNAAADAMTQVLSTGSATPASPPATNGQGTPPAQPPARPRASDDVTIPHAVTRQNQFLTDLRDNTIPACQAHKDAQEAIAGLASQIVKNEDPNSPERCVFTRTQEFYGRASAGISKLSEDMETLKERARENYAIDLAKNKEAIDRLRQAREHIDLPLRNLAQNRIDRLNRELGAIWGQGATPEAVKQSNYAFRKDSVFGSIMDELTNQNIALTRQKGWLAQQEAKMRLLSGKCGPGSTGQSTTEGRQQTTPGTGAPAPGNTTQNNGQTTSIATPGTNCMDPTTGYTSLNPQGCATGSASSIGQTTGGAQRDGNENGGNNNNNNNNGGGETTGGQRNGNGASQNPPAPVEEESWFSKNKTPLIIGGVGVAAVAGALLWKKSEDDKAKDKASLMELEAMAAAQTQQQQNSSSSSSDGSASGDSTAGGSIGANQTPVGSSLMIEGSPSGSVGANTNLPPITVKVVNPEGIMTNDSATDISVSCASSTPAPCTLTGTVTVNTDMGKAVFSGLKFTGAHSNVTLLFSAPGFAAVKSGNFDVSGRQ